MPNRLLEPLHEDHAVLARFERVLARLLEGRRFFELSLDDVVLPVQFAELFLDSYHNRREDAGLFATLRELRRRGRNYPVYEMHEHDELVGAIRTAKRTAHSSAPDARARYVHLLRTFLAALVEHRSFEDGMIFPQLEHELTPEDAQLVRTNIGALLPHGAEILQHATLLLERMEELAGLEVESASEEAA
jgi:hemerythrin-like domain-containing protein